MKLCLVGFRRRSLSPLWIVGKHHTFPPPKKVSVLAVWKLRTDRNTRLLWLILLCFKPAQPTRGEVRNRSPVGALSVGCP